MLQKKYGRTPSELKTIVDGFLWTMTDYTLRQTLWAMKEYTKRKADIPAPADLIAILEEGRRQKIEAKQQAKPATSRDENPLAARERHARRLQGEYWDYFRAKPQAEAFASEKQKAMLRSYVRAAAWLQAQMIAGYQSQGVEWANLLCESPEMEPEREAILAEANLAKERGNIAVSLPARLFDAAGINPQQQIAA